MVQSTASAYWVAEDNLQGWIIVEYSHREGGVLPKDWRCVYNAYAFILRGYGGGWKYREFMGADSPKGGMQIPDAPSVREGIAELVFQTLLEEGESGDA